MPYRTLFAGMLLIVGTAWLFYLKVPIPGPVSTAAWVIGLICWVWGYVRVLQAQASAALISPSANFPSLQTSTLLALTLGLLMPPVLSKDVYIYLLQGKLALQGVCTYTDGNLNNLHPWVEFVDPQWRDCPNHYGPVPMLLFSLVAYFNTISGALIALKIAFLAIAFATLKVIDNIANRFNIDKNRAVLAVALNPIFILQGLGQMHLDLLTGLLVALFIYGLFAKPNWLICGLSIGALGLTKTLLLPVFLGFWVIYQAWTLRNNIFQLREAILGIGLALMLFCVGYAPIWQGTQTLTHPMSYHSDKEPVKSVAELAAYAGVFLTNPVVAPDVPNKLVAQKILIGKKVTPILQILALLLALVVAWRAYQKPDKKGLLFQMGLLTLLIFIGYSPIMHPWYFLLVLPFFALYTDNRTVVLYLGLTFGLANLYEVGSLLEGSLGKTITIAGTVLSVFGYFVGFRRFFS
jgi:alpha-1,6-mannosyltransferase